MRQQGCNNLINKFVGRQFINKEYTCWDLVRDVYKEYGYEVPSYFSWMYDAFDSDSISKTIKNIIKTKTWIPILKPVEPCVILFKNCSKEINHLGVYIGNNEFLHNLYKVGTIKSSLKEDRWNRILVGYYIYHEQTKYHKS